WIRLQTGKISFGVGGVFDGMIAVEESRDVEVCADVLDHDIRRVAPAPYRDIAIGQRESFHRLPIRAANHFEACSRRMREARRIERVDSLQISAELILDLLLALRGSIAELRTKGRPRARVDSERCRVFGIEPQ